MMEFPSLLLSLFIAAHTILLKLPTAECNLDERNSLIYSQTICRHGNRNPQQSYGKYKENYENIWPEGPMQLNQLGKAEAQGIGKFLRDRYTGFLGESYNLDEIFVLSSSIDRTIKTAQMSMLGLYTDFGNVTLREKRFSNHAMPFEPVPIRTVPSELDNMLNLHPNCPRRTQSIINSINADFARSHFQNDTAIEYILANAGLEGINSNGTTLEGRMFAVIEVITSLYEQNKTLEDWMVPLLSDQKFMSYKYRQTEIEQAADLATHRVNVGALWELIVKNTNDRLNGIHRKKLDVFIGHDKNLLSLGWALGINATFNEHMPPPASCILLEFHETHQQEQEEVTVEFWYRKTSGSAQRAVSSSCGDPCTLSRLMNITADVMNVDFDKECQLD